jgi:hypothetical protein
MMPGRGAAFVQRGGTSLSAPRHRNGAPSAASTSASRPAA